MKACETFKLTYQVTNHGPDVAQNVVGGVLLPDPFDVVSHHGVPRNLKAGQSATVVEVIKVTAFVPGESRHWTIYANFFSDGIDPKPHNNTVTSAITISGNHVMTCP